MNDPILVYSVLAIAIIQLVALLLRLSGRTLPVMAKAKEPEIRTLADGYEVIHHPDGKQVIRPGQSRLRERMLDAHPHHQISHAAKQIRKRNLVDWRRERMRRRGVPAEKRCC